MDDVDYRRDKEIAAKVARFHAHEKRAAEARKRVRERALRRIEQLVSGEIEE